jgi:hypothetical protein
MTIFQWVTTILNRLQGAARSPSTDLQSHILWEKFIKSSDMLIILYADHPSQLPSSPQHWDSLCQTACDLWNSLMKDSLIDLIPMCYPTLCLLMKGRYYYQNLPERAADMIFAEVPSINLVRSLATCPYCPLSFAERVLNNHKNQLWIADYETNQTPLHVLCIQQKRSSESTAESMIPLFVRLCVSSASEMDKEERYPLHCACQSVYSWKTGIDDLVLAAPSTISKEYNNQVPFELLAIALSRKKDEVNQRKSSRQQVLNEIVVSEAEKVKEIRDIETLFEVLRLYPSIVLNWRNE